MDFQTWLSFAGASFILSLAPGPDNIFVLMQSVIYGKIRRAEDCFGIMYRTPGSYFVSGCGESRLLFVLLRPLSSV